MKSTFLKKTFFPSFGKDQHRFFSVSMRSGAFGLRTFFLILGTLAALLPTTSLAQQSFAGRLNGALNLVSTASTLSGKLQGITIRLASTTDATVISTTTTALGEFSFTNITLGTYTVTPVQTGAAFFPQSTSITITTQDVARISFGFVPVLPELRGQVISTQSLPFPFANVVISGAGIRIVTGLNANGEFSVPVSTAGTYSLTPTTSSLRLEHVFSPRSQASTVDAFGNVSGTEPVFVASVPQYRLRGVLKTLAGELISGNAAVRIEQLSPLGNAVGGTITTAVISVAGGEFTVNLTNGTYRVTTIFSAPTPITITPNPIIVGVTDANVDVGEILITNRRFVVQGRIVTSLGTQTVPMGLVPVRFEQPITNILVSSTTTDADGRFRLLVDASRYFGVTLRLTARIPGFTLLYNGSSADSSLLVSGFRDDADLGEILAVRIPPQQFPIAGRVLYPDRQPVREPITVIVTNASGVVPEPVQARITVDADGSYSISGVTTGVFRISLRSPNLVFSPSLIEISSPRDAGTPFNFTATFRPISVNGIVQSVVGEPISGAEIRVAGINGIVATTNTLGRYSLSVSGQFPGSRWSLVPILRETVFFPASRLVVSNVNSLFLNSMDFRVTSTTNTLPLSTINGRITYYDNNNVERPLEAALLTDGTRTTKTSTDGTYALSGVPNGTFTVTPTLEGYVFTPQSLEASIIAGNNIRNQNFVARLRNDATNRPPFVRTPINDIPVIATTTTPIPLGTVFADVNGDSLQIITSVEDPTLLRTRLENNSLLIDALSEGNTMITVTALDGRGGSTNASFRVTVSRPFATPTLFVRSRGEINTNINAAIVIEPRTIIALAGIPEKGSSGLAALSGELGAFNSKCECVGSIVWSGNRAVLPIWGEDAENNVPGMKAKDPIQIRFIDNLDRRSRLTRPIYIHNRAPSLWPIDKAVITSIPELENNECLPAQSVISSARIEQNDFTADIFPNPVANGAVITYTLPKAGMVSVEIWSMLGQRVTVLRSEHQSEGNHRLNFNVDDLMSGMYICRIQASNNAGFGKQTSVIRLSVIR